MAARRIGSTILKVAGTPPPPLIPLQKKGTHEVMFWPLHGVSQVSKSLFTLSGLVPFGEFVQKDA